MKVFNLLCLFFAIAAVIFYIVYFALTENTLQYVIIYFRYGDSTPFSETYAEDPYANQDYYPYGRDQLTLEGERKMIDLGRKLHRRYQSFLGSTYSPDLIYALSSYQTKCVMSLSLVLASFVPPEGTQIIEPGLNWQPISYEVLPKETDDMLAYWNKCTNVFDADTNKATDQRYGVIYDYISSNSGENVTSAYEAAYFYRTFKAQLAYGLQLPEWASRIHPQPLNLIRHGLFRALTKSTLAKKYSTGRLWKHVSNKFTDKMNVESAANGKLSIFSGYSNGLAGLLSTLDIDGDYDYPFGSYMLVELHKINGNYGVKVFYADDLAEDPQPKSVGTCGEFCPIETFLNLTQIYHPNPNIC